MDLAEGVAAGTAAAADVEDTVADALIRRGKLDRASLERARRLHRERGSTAEHLHFLLTQLGLVAEADVAAALAEVLHLPLVGAADFPDEAVLADVLSARFLKEAHVIPLAEAEGAVRLAMANPLDAFSLQAVEIATHRPVSAAVALPADIERAFERLYGSGGTAISQLVDGLGEAETAERDEDEERLKDQASEAPVIRLVNLLISRAAAGLALTVRQGGLRADGTVYAWQFGDGEARFSISDEGGKIDLNTAPRTLLRDLLKVVGADREADLLADAIVAYRGGDAPDGEDEAAFSDEGAGATPFALLAELQRVPGMTGEIYRLIAPALTVYGDQPEPDARAAPPVVREALARRQNRRQAEPLGPAEAEEAVPLPPEGPLSILAEGTFARRSSLGVFTIHCEGRSRGGAIFVREAVIAGDYGGGNPFSVRAWNQGRRMLFPRPGEAEPIL